MYSSSADLQGFFIVICQILHGLMFFQQNYVYFNLGNKQAAVQHYTHSGQMNQVFIKDVKQLGAVSIEFGLHAPYEMVSETTCSKSGMGWGSMSQSK